MSAGAITVQRTKAPRPRGPESSLGFGEHFTDHMFVMDYDPSRGWHEPRIVPYGPISIDPAAGAIQYGQSLFEGLKAFAGADGRPRLFRPEMHAARLNASARRLCMPEIAPAVLLDGVRALLREDADWTPKAPGTSLYLRPTMFATEGFLGVRPSKRYALVVLVSPVGSYWKDRTGPLKIWVEDKFVRAAPGGMGAAKAGGNYAVSLLAAEAAKARGYDQVLWLDAVHRRYVEEIGTMNLFVRIGDEVLTPPLEGTVLPGVTRDCVLTMLRDWGVPATERAVSLDEIEAAHARGTLREVFGTGTAAVVAPIGELAWGEKRIAVASREGDVAPRLRDAITAVQYGQAADPHRWLVDVLGR